MVTDALTLCSTEGLRIRSWRGSPDVAHLTPITRPGTLATEAVDQGVRQLTALGIKQIVTSAVGPPEEAVLTRCGFTIRERLTLLANDLTSITTKNPLSRTRSRRAQTRERVRLLEIDHAAFQGFWQLDREGINDTINATPHTRVRVLEHDDQIAAYAITGRAGDHGFLQRLAVDPVAQGHGLGAALVLDSLQWCKRHRVRRVLVNTQVDNERARGLYIAMRFEPEPYGLAVLEWNVPA